jgi:MoxR-like ATPase
MKELTQNLWERYGFSDNPFDTRALSLNHKSGLSVSDAYVGRKSMSIETDLLNKFLRMKGGGRIIVEGDPGVGKTTYVNYHRYIWEYQAKEKLLSPASEISVQQDWTPYDFLLSLLGSLTGRLRLDIPESEFKKDKILTEITAFTEIMVKTSTGVSIGMSIFGTGGNVRLGIKYFIKTG